MSKTHTLKHWNTPAVKLIFTYPQSAEMPTFYSGNCSGFAETSSCQTKASEHATCSSNIQLVQKAVQLGHRTPDEIATVSESLSG